MHAFVFVLIISIDVREGGAGGAAASLPICSKIYLFGQKLSCNSGNDIWCLDEYIDP